MYKQILEEFFKKEYILSNIVIREFETSISVTLYLDNESDNYYFDKVKFFNFNKENKKLYIDISTGGDIFLECKLFEKNNIWLNFVDKYCNA